MASSTVKDAGVASGAFHMYADAETLDILQTSPIDRLVVRLFQWDKPTVSYGYLLDDASVQRWADSLQIGSLDRVKRPTGGGAVLHSPSDLSFSLAWRREHKFFSDTPRACYEAIHRRLLQTISSFCGSASPTLYSPPQRGGTRGGACEAALQGNPTPIPSPDGEGNKNLVPVCFKEPVCNDVMQNGQKVIGGALRITKNAILYQGTIQLPNASLNDLKDAVRRAFA